MITIWELFLYGLIQAIIIALLVKKFFPKAKLVGPLVMWHSKRGLKILDRIAGKWPKFWKSYGDFGVILAFGVIGAWYVFRKHSHRKRFALSLAASSFLLAPYIGAAIQWVMVGESPTQLALNLFTGNDPIFSIVPVILLYAGGFSTSLVYLLGAQALSVISGYLNGVPVTAMVGPAIPGIDVKGSPIQGVSWLGWVSLIILLFVHETSHGILARLGKFKVKSAGVILFGVFPFGAFVEPDEKALRKGPTDKQLRVYSVGSTANYLLSFATLVFLLAAVQPALTATGIDQAFQTYLDHPQIVTLEKEGNAFGKLVEGSKILGINGTEVRTVQDVHDVTAALGPGADAEIATDAGTAIIKLNENTLIGISSLKNTFKPMPLWMQGLVAFLDILSTTIFFNFAVGIMNLLPMYPLDGGFMAEALTKKRFGAKKAKSYVKMITLAVLVLFLVNLLPLFFPNY
ncbi:MAG: site-2 protease family protein [Candidatus Diapherotrites archaeon]|nr:site-2 protease family protein [Candidatus Diapherotrites archaeon]